MRVGLTGLVTSAAIVVDLGLLQFEVEVEPEFGGVIENDAPLIELGTIVVKLVVA